MQARIMGTCTMVSISHISELHASAAKSTVCAGSRSQAGQSIIGNQLSPGELDAWLLYSMLPAPYAPQNLTQQGSLASELQFQGGNQSYNLTFSSIAATADSTSKVCQLHVPAFDKAPVLAHLIAI